MQLIMSPRCLLVATWALSFLSVSQGFAPISHHQHRQHASCRLYGIRCENKYYQLEEMEDRDTSTTELFLKDSGVVDIGETDGPLWTSASGSWSVQPGTDDFTMKIVKTFGAGAKGNDMGEFDYTVERTFEGEMTLVGESVAITGVTLSGEDKQEVGFFNMIDGTDIRKDARVDARPGVKGEKDPTKVEQKNDATATHLGDLAGVGVAAVTAASKVVGGGTGLPPGWEEHWDTGQQRPFYVDTMSGNSQWEKPGASNQQAQATAVATTLTDALPAGWIEQLDPAQNKMYYVNTETGVSQWEKPGSGLPAGWQEHFDPAQQRSFYVNTTTGASQWERPL